MLCTRVLVLAILGIAVCGPAATGQTTLRLYFDPAEFYDFLELDPGPVDTFSTDGGMFKLWEIWGVEGPPQTTLRSWRVSDRQLIDDWAASVTGPNEGIGFFNTDLTLSTNGLAWGQDMSTPITIDEAFAPPGWTSQINGNAVAWTAANETFYVRPDTSAYANERSFGFEITTNDSISLGDLETIWFGGFNWFLEEPAITFGTWGPPGFASVDARPGTGFEATLKLVRDYIESDFNDDRVVDGDDFLLWQTGFGIGSGAEHIDGDANADGIVDGNDFLIWQAQLGTSVPGEGSASVAIPEPTSALLLGLSLLLLLSRRDRSGR